MNRHLSIFVTNVSPWANPKDWLRTYQHQTNCIMIEIFANFTCGPRIEALKDLGSLIYQVRSPIQSHCMWVSQPATASFYLCRRPPGALHRWKVFPDNISSCITWWHWQPIGSLCNTNWIVENEGRYWNGRTSPNNQIVPPGYLAKGIKGR